MILFSNSSHANLVKLDPNKDKKGQRRRTKPPSQSVFSTANISSLDLDSKQYKMCNKYVRRYAYCKISPNHGYWQFDRCVESLRNGGTLCQNIVEVYGPLPAPIGADWCPFAGCSEDPNYQLPNDIPVTAKGRKAWGSRSK